MTLKILEKVRMKNKSKEETSDKLRTTSRITLYLKALKVSLDR
jgi:hypothetical protein